MAARSSFSGPWSLDQRDALLGGATALLQFWIQFDEPFGLSVIEAMATGTPVIAFRRGSMAELIVDGTSGLLVAPGDIDAAVAAVARIGELDRQAVRQHVERSFSATRMVDDYLRLYQRVLGAPGGGVRASTRTTAPRATSPRRPLRCVSRTQGPRGAGSRDGLLTVCASCARGIDVSLIDIEEAISSVVARAPASERRKLTRRLQARQAMHAARRERSPRSTAGSLN